MARQRMVKPEFFMSESLGSVSVAARLAFIGLLVNADDYGNLKAQASRLRTSIFPYDDMDDAGFKALLAELEAVGCIKGYEDGGSLYITAPNFSIYQTVNRPSKSTVPEPPEYVRSGAPTELLREWSQGRLSERSVSTHAKEVKKEDTPVASFAPVTADGAALAGATPPACPECGKPMEPTMRRDGKSYVKAYRCAECES